MTEPKPSNGLKHARLIDDTTMREVRIEFVRQVYRHLSENGEYEVAKTAAYEWWSWNYHFNLPKPVWVDDRQVGEPDNFRLYSFTDLAMADEAERRLPSAAEGYVWASIKVRLLVPPPPVPA